MEQDNIPQPDPFSDPLFWKYYDLFTNTGSASNNNISPEVQKDKLYSASWPSNIHSKINIGYPVPSRENALLKQITGDVAVDRINKLQRSLLLSQLYLSVNILLTFRNHLHVRIISLKGDVWVHKTS
jgi:hypothetical protein